MKKHYVYLLINDKTDMMYIGKRSCDCLPDEDTSYMSSSKYVPKEECDKLILEEFSTAKEAIAYEALLHHRFDVMNNDKFYNKANQTSTKFDTTGCKWQWSEEHKAKISKALTGVSKSEIAKVNNSIAQKALYEAGYMNPRTGITLPQELKDKISQRKKELGCDKGIKNNRFSPWFIQKPNGEKLEFHNITKEDQAVKDGYKKGRYQDLAAKSKGITPIKRGPFKGYIIGNIVNDIV